MGTKLGTKKILTQFKAYQSPRCLTVNHHSPALLKGALAIRKRKCDGPSNLKNLRRRLVGPGALPDIPDRAPPHCSPCKSLGHCIQLCSPTLLSGCVFVCILVFAKPLHAARRAMAAASAAALAGSSSNHFPAFNQILSPSLCETNWGYPISFPP